MFSNQINMKPQNDFFFKLWKVLAWIIFLGLCVETGGYVFNTAFTLFINPAGASNFWSGLDLSALYQHSESKYVMITVMMCIMSCLKAIMFYQVVSLFYKKKMDWNRPFNDTLGRTIQLIAWIAIGIAFYGMWGEAMVRKMLATGLRIPSVEELKFGGNTVWLFMGVTLLILASIFKKGVELQNENDLTV